MTLKYFIEKRDRYSISEGPLYAFDGTKWYVFDFNDKKDFIDYREPYYPLEEINPYLYLADERYNDFKLALQKHLIKDLFE